MKPPHDVKGGAEVVGPAQLRNLRLIVSPPGKKGTWLRKLNDRRLAEVYMRLSHGQSAFRIAQIAQREWNVMTKSNTRSLCRALYLFTTAALGEVKAEVTNEPPSKEKSDMSAGFGNRRRVLNKKLDAMGRLGWLIEQQTERFEMALALEKKTSMPLKHTDVVVKRLGDLLDKYLDYAVKLGLIDSKPPELSLKVKHMFDGFVGQMGDDGQKVAMAGQRFLELAAEGAMTLTMAEDGSYSLKRPEVQEEETEDVPA